MTRPGRPIEDSFSLPAYLTDEDALLDLLRGVANLEDPVPAAVTLFAHKAPSLIGLDCELAQLLDESDLALVGGLRGTDDTRHYRFSLDEGTVQVDVLHGLVLGEFDEPGWDADVIYTDGQVAASVDDLMFEFQPRQSRFALKFRRGARELATEWLRA